MKLGNTLIGWIGEVARRLWRSEKMRGDRPAFNQESVVGKQRTTPARDWLPAELATAVWQVRKRLCEVEIAGPPQNGAALRDADALLDALAHAGVEVFDPLGDAFDPRQAVKVLAFRPTPGLDRARVIETVRPTVYLHSRWVQRAEVIVGVPDSLAVAPGRRLPG